ncbi:HET-domain-containing protein, partial [Polychaeton citri CBS 116435]
MHRYTPLAPDSIRVLAITPALDSGHPLIECSLRHYPLQHASQEQYTAISYTWGKPRSGEKVIRLDGADFRVRRNLYWCLRGLRSHGFVHNIWLDAICIDQNNTPERNAQVALMGAIYRQASLVITWIGGRDLVFDNFCKRLEECHLSLEEAGIQNFKKLRKSAAWCSQRPYFARMWVIQENVLAAERLLLCGDYQCSWEKI